MSSKQSFSPEKKKIGKNRARPKILLGIGEIKWKQTDVQTTYIAQPITGRARNNICMWVKQLLQQYPSMTQNYHLTENNWV